MGGGGTTGGQAAVGMGVWMREEKVDFGTVRYRVCMSMNGGMLPLPSHHRSKNLFHHETPEDMTHEFYKELYTNIIRDIDVSS